VQARGDLLERERLYDVVVGALLEAADAVGHLVASGQHAHRQVVAGGAQAPEHLEAVEVGHRQVEQHDGRPHRADRLERGPPARRAHDVEALELEADGHRAADRGVVVDQQDDGASAVAGRGLSHGSPARSRARRRRRGRRARGRVRGRRRSGRARRRAR